MGHRGKLHQGLGLYGLAWKLALPWLKKNTRLRRGFHQRTNVEHLDKADLWIQAASAGEAYLAVALICAITFHRPLTILITTTTIQGMDILEKGLRSPDMDPQVCVKISFFPFDAPVLMEQAVAKVCPSVMVLLETELWPGLLACLKHRRIPVIMVNARLSEKSVSRYRHFPRLCRTLAPDIILPISGEDARRFRQIFPASTIHTMHNIKFDTLIPRNMTHKPWNTPLPRHPFPPNTPVTLLASIRMEEESHVADILVRILQHHPHQVVGLFPRHMHRIPFWQACLSQMKIPWQLRSTITAPVLPGSIILWDTFGELKAACGHATAAFVGGSLKPLGGQNFMEPVMCGVSTVTGPYLDNFNWVGQGLFTAGVVTRASDTDTVVHHLCRLLDSPPQRQQTASVGLGYIRRYQGGTDLAVNTIIKTLKSSEKP
ncbi:lipid IV(A) 3-deoxy-D-manno-octulosonic acid transferase [Desulfocicer niacini]